MAHLLEHLVFKGTPTIANIFQELGRRGMRSTARRSSTAPTTTRRSPPPTRTSTGRWRWKPTGWSTRSSRRSRPRHRDDGRAQRVRELARTTRSSVLWGRLQAAAYDWHNYGNLTIGARSDIENVGIERLQAFYRTYYQPDNAVLIVAGKFDPATHARAHRAATSARSPSPTRDAAGRSTPREPVQDGERTVTVRRVGSAQFVGALFRTPPGAHPDATALAALGEVMTVEPVGPPLPGAGRDQEGERRRGLEPRRCATRATSSSGRRCRWAIRLDAARDAMLATLDGVTRPADHRRPRSTACARRRCTSFDETFNDPQQLGVALSESIALGDWRLFFLQRDRWRAAHRRRRAARRRSSTSSARTSRSGSSSPTPSPIARRTPPAVDVAAMVKDYKGDRAGGRRRSRSTRRRRTSRRARSGSRCPTA